MNSAAPKYSVPASSVIHHHPAHHALPHQIPPAPPSSASSTSSPSPPLPHSPHDPQSPLPEPPAAPVTPATHGNAEAICEAAAKLLFMNIKWVKNVPAFVALPFSDQCLLLAEAWRELFVLAAAQFQIPIDAATLLHAAGTRLNHTTTQLYTRNKVNLCFVCLMQDS